MHLDPIRGSGGTGITTDRARTPEGISYLFQSHGIGQMRVFRLWRTTISRSFGSVHVADLDKEEFLAAMRFRIGEQFGTFLLPGGRDLRLARVYAFR